MNIYQAPEGQFVATVSSMPHNYKRVQSYTDSRNVELILNALANGDKISEGICSLPVLRVLQARWPKVYGPKTKLQHRKVWKDDSIVSEHSKWHDLTDLDCNHDEFEARAVIAKSGGIADAGYCLNMFREVKA